MYFKTGKLPTNCDLHKLLKGNPHFQALYSHVAQQTLTSVAESFKSFKALSKLFASGKLVNKPKLPNYKKNSLKLATFPKADVKLRDGLLRLPLGSKVKTWFGLDAFYLPMPSNLNFADIKEIRILPRNRCFYAEFIYKLEVEKPVLDPAKALGIDHGIDNWLTCVSNIGTSFIVDKIALAWVKRIIKSLFRSLPLNLKNELSELYGIEYIETEESYTSKASFVDRDYLPTIGAKPDGWKESGKRVKRGLYRTGSLNWYINADCNGAANILRKVATMLGLCLNGLGRGTLAAPQRIKL